MTQNEKDRIIKANMALGMTLAEAEKALADDLRIDKGETCEWEIEQTPEQKKMLRKLLRVESDKPKEKAKRVKPADTDKRLIIDTINRALNDNLGATNIFVENIEREITFTYADTNYKITLSVPRVPK